MEDIEVNKGDIIVEQGDNRLEGRNFSHFQRQALEILGIQCNHETFWKDYWV